MMEDSVYALWSERAFPAAILKRYPFVQTDVFGKTVCARQLNAFSLGHGKENILLLAGMDAQETENMYFLRRLILRMAQSLAADIPLCGILLKNSLRGRTVTVVPCLNPDGAAIAERGAAQAGCYRGLVARAAKGDFKSWHANARGVELCHAFWTETKTAAKHGIHRRGCLGAPFGYGGAGTAERETEALCRLCRAKRFRHVTALCGTGGKLIQPAIGLTALHGQLPMALKILSESTGYPLVKEPICADSFAAWFGRSFQRPVFTAAPRPLDLQQDREGQIDRIYGEIEEMLLLSMLL